MSAYSDAIAALPSRVQVERVLAESEGVATLAARLVGIQSRQVLVKVRPLADARAVGAFREYGAAMARLPREGLVPVESYGVYDAEGRTFGYTLREYVAGRSLSELSVPFGEQDIWQVALDTSTALRCLHESGVLHLDLKAENVIASRRGDSHDFFVIDIPFRAESNFGAIAEVSVQYLAPEVLRGDRPSARCDLYSLGVLLYWLATGTLPFAGRSLADVLAQQQSRGYTPLERAAPHVSAALRGLIESMLEPYPERRIQSAAAAEALAADSGFVSYRRPALEIRFPEVAEIRAALDRECTATWVSGEPGSGVSSVLTRLLDELETAEIAVLSAIPSSVAGVSIASQLALGVDRLARGSGASNPASATGVLDDLDTVTKRELLVVVVDDVHLAGPGDVSFLARALRQERSRVARGTDSTIGLRLVMGAHQRNELAAEVDKSIAIRPLCVDTIRSRRRSLSTAALKRALRESGGNLLRCTSLLCGTSGEGRPAEDTTSNLSPEDKLQLARVVWGRALDPEMMRALAKAFGADSEFAVEEVIQRSRVQADPVTLREVCDTVLAVTSELWRSDDIDTLESMASVFVSSSQDRRRIWSMRRALVLMLRCGRLEETRSLAARVGDAGCSAIESAAAAEIADGDNDSASTSQFYASWIKARSLRRGRYARDALKVLIGVRRRAARSHPWHLQAVLAEYVAASADCGNVRAATVACRLLRREVKKSTGQRALSRARKLVRYLRARYRWAIMVDRIGLAARLCVLESRMQRALGCLGGVAASLNNLGICHARRGRSEDAGQQFNRVASLRERLDDERGIVVALNNLATVCTTASKFDQALTMLTRAQFLAERNGLRRHARLAMLNRGMLLAKCGQYERSLQALATARRHARRDDDVNACALATYNAAMVCLDTWRLKACRAYQRALRAIPVATLRRTRTIPEILDIELAWRSGDLEAVRDIAGRHGATWPEIQQYADALRGARSANRVLRFRSVFFRVARRERTVRAASCARLTRAALARGLIHEAWIGLVELARIDSGGRQYVREMLRTSRLQEGHDVWQTLCRAQLVASGSKAAPREQYEDLVQIVDRSRQFALGVGARGDDSFLQEWEERLVSLLEGETGLSSVAPVAAAAFSKIAALDVTMSNDTMTPGFARSGQDVLSCALKKTGAERAAVVWDVNGDLELIGIESIRTDLDRSLSWATIRRAVAENRELVHDEALTEAQLSGQRSIASLSIHSLACFPIRRGQQVLGAVYFDHSSATGLFNGRARRPTEAIAEQVGVVFERDMLRAASQGLEAQAVELKRTLVRTERSRLAGELAASVTHDAKNMFAAILARGQLLRIKNCDSDVVRSATAIEKAAKTGAALLERLQQCSADHEHQESRIVDVRGIAEEAADLVAPRVTNRGVLVEIVGEARAYVIPGALREALLNLLINAADASDSGDRVVIAVAESDESCTVAIRDEGAGMSDTVASRVFEPFFTTKGEAGTGLGLAIVRDCVVRCGGRIAMESIDGEGTTFTLTLLNGRGAPLGTPRNQSLLADD